MTLVQPSSQAPPSTCSEGLASEAQVYATVKKMVRDTVIGERETTSAFAASEATMHIMLIEPFRKANLSICIGSVGRRRCFRWE